MTKKDQFALELAEVGGSFPTITEPDVVKSVILQWQEVMSPSNWLPVPCAVCGRSALKDQISLVQPADIDLTLLRNPCLPPETLSTTYNFLAYNLAILYHNALRDKHGRGPFDVCDPCLSSLKNGEQPLDSLANFWA